MDVARTEAEYGESSGCLDTLTGGSCPATTMCQYAQIAGLEDAEALIGRSYPQYDFLATEGLSLLQRPDLRLSLGENLSEQGLHLVDATEDSIAPGEHLHRDDRIDPFLLEDLNGSQEVDICRIAAEPVLRNGPLACRWESRSRFDSGAEHRLYVVQSKPVLAVVK